MSEIIPPVTYGVVRGAHETFDLDGVDVVLPREAREVYSGSDAGDAWNAAEVHTRIGHTVYVTIYFRQDDGTPPSYDVHVSNS